MHAINTCSYIYVYVRLRAACKSSRKGGGGRRRYVLADPYESTENLSGIVEKLGKPNQEGCFHT